MKKTELNERSDVRLAIECQNNNRNLTKFPGNRKVI